VLQVTSQRAAEGSAQALQALGALSNLDKDAGAAIFAAFLARNPYAVAMVTLNDWDSVIGHAHENVGTLWYVAGAASMGKLDALVVSKAIAAIDNVSGFAPSDSTNTATVTLLTGSSRVRVAADLYAVLLLGAVEAQFGTAITAYKSATGSATLSSADMPGLMGNRINAAPLSGNMQELKEWMALLNYVGTGLKGSITSDYASTRNFAEFASFGAAVKTRNATYPITTIGRLMTTLGGLQAAP
jgi:hypothetical protein